MHLICLIDIISRLIQEYILREETGTLAPEAFDMNKVSLVIVIIILKDIIFLLKDIYLIQTVQLFVPYKSEKMVILTLIL